MHVSLFIVGFFQAVLRQNCFSLSPQDYLTTEGGATLPIPEVDGAAPGAVPAEVATATEETATAAS